jgi:hypothetical protein
MFLRSHQRSKDGKEHTYWSLVETVRTPEGPRQRTLCYLGELNSSAQARWLRTIEVFNDQGEGQQLRLYPSDIEPPGEDAGIARVLLNKVRLERTREFGGCWLGLELWKRLQLDRFFTEVMDEHEADVPWSRVAAVLSINRLCAPGSELAIEERWYPTTALDDLLGIEEGKINDTRLYRCLDRMLPHKTKLERHLKQRYGELFGAEFDVLLYDLTSSYVEGRAEKNPMMRRGYSRDHRPDCEQMVIALIVNSEVPRGEETYILCRTAGRKEKEQAIRQRFSTRMEDALKRLAKTIETGRLKDRNKMERRLGAIQARHPQLNDLYEVALNQTPEGLRLAWEIKEERKVWRGLREGAYMLRTNIEAGTAQELWSRYMQLTEAEASFRALKSELSIRPLFHQKEPRVKAHVMVAFLGYALWVTLKHMLKRRPAIVPQPSVSGVTNAQPLSAMKALALLNTLHSADIVLPTTDGREIRLRRITEPTAEQKSLLKQLGLTLPERFEFHRQCSADSAMA